MTLALKTYVSAYWGDRAEGPTSAAHRLEAMLSRLETISPDFTQWTDRHHAPLPRGAELQGWFKAAYDTTTTKRPPQLGAHVWSTAHGGGEDRTVLLRVTVGLHAGMPHRVSNALIVRSDLVNDNDILEPAAADILHAVTTNWEPDWAIATNNWQLSNSRTSTRRFFPGTISWLSEHLVTPTIATTLTDLGAKHAKPGWVLDLRGQEDPDTTPPLHKPIAAAGWYLKQAGL